jgi:replicative DNA helicase
MGQVNLTDEHVDPQTERAVLAALSRADDPARRFDELEPSEKLFGKHAQAFVDLRSAIEAGEDVPEVPEEWTTAEDPAGAVRELKALQKRRRAAEVQEILSDGIGGQRPIEDACETANERLADLQGDFREDTAGTLRYADDLVPEVLSSAKEARKRIQAGEDVLPGIRSGIDAFDEILGGFQEGLTIVGGGPGIGKTTYALQAARHAAKDEEAPVLYVTFENSPEGLTRKGICSIAGVSARAVRRGQVPTEKVRAAAKRWGQETRRLAFVEGTADLTTSRIRTKAKRHTGRFGADRCLIVLDYLQLFAKRSEQFERYTDQRERVQAAGNAIRAVGMGLRSPVLAIASQSRKAGNYGGDDAQENETGSARLDSLKESGDLEYSADAVAFLTPPISDPSRSARVVEPNRAVDLTVAKNRHGETGRVELVFRQAEGTMMPEAKHDEAPQGTTGKAPPGGDSAPF